MKTWFNNLKLVVAIKLFFATRKLAKQKTKDKETLEAWLNDKNNRQETLVIAKAFNQIFKGGWFSISQVLKQTTYKDLNSAMRILTVFKLMGVLVIEVRGEREMYKIVIGEKNKLTVLLQQKKKLEQNLKDIEIEIKELEKALKEN